MSSKILIGNCAGQHFNGCADLTVAYHAIRVRANSVNAVKQSGFFMRRKWLFDRAAFEYDPTLGWAYEHWFEWQE